MTFSVRQAIADADLAPFEYEDANGHLKSLPHAKTLTPAQGLRVMLHGEIEEVFNEVADGAGTAIMELPSFAVEELMLAWMKHSDVDLSEAGMGKLPRSSPSSRNTRRSSKRT